MSMAMLVTSINNSLCDSFPFAMVPIGRPVIKQLLIENCYSCCFMTGRPINSKPLNEPNDKIDSSNNNTTTTTPPTTTKTTTTTATTTTRAATTIYQRNKRETTMCDFPKRACKPNSSSMSTSAAARFHKQSCSI